MYHRECTWNQKFKVPSSVEKPISISAKFRCDDHGTKQKPKRDQERTTEGCGKAIITITMASQSLTKSYLIASVALATTAVSVLLLRHVRNSKKCEQGSFADDHVWPAPPCIELLTYF